MKKLMSLFIFCLLTTGLFAKDTKDIKNVRLLQNHNVVGVGYSTDFITFCLDGYKWLWTGSYHANPVQMYVTHIGSGEQRLARCDDE